MKEDLTNKEIEIKDIADGMSFEIDTADLWANIEPQLPPIDDRNNKPIWWMATGVLFIFILFGGAFSYFSDSSINIPEKNDLTSELLVTESDKIENNQKIIQTQKNSSIATPNNSQNKNSKINKHTHTSFTNYDDEHSHDKKGNSSIVKTKKVANDIAVILQPITENESTKFDLNEKQITQSDITKNNINQLSRNIASGSEKRLLIEDISALKMKEFLNLKNTSTLSIPLSIIEPLKLNKWHSFWQVNSGINTSSNRISFSDSEVTFDPQFGREQNLIGQSNSIHYGQEDRNGWRLFGGLSHIRTTTRYSNFEESITTNLKTGVESKTIDQYGNEFETIGQISVTSIIQNDIVWHRSHDNINLEMGFGKRHRLLEKLSLVTDAYLGYNIWSLHNGYYIEENNPIITKFTNSEHHPYQNKGIDIASRLGVEYDLGILSIGFSGYYSHGLGNTTKTNNYYQIKNSHYGVQLGVVYRP
jgi:hypothetical protein